MAWSTPLTAVANAALTAAQWNASVRDNLLETGVAKAATAGGYAVSTGVNSVAERVPQTVSVTTSETTTSTSATDLATVGPAVTATTSGCALVAWSGFVSNNTVNGVGYIFMDLTGATTLGVTDATCILNYSSTANAAIQCSYTHRFPTTAGSNTFTQKYRVNTGTGTFANRRTTVFPF